MIIYYLVQVQCNFGIVINQVLNTAKVMHNFYFLIILMTLKFKTWVIWKDIASLIKLFASNSSLRIHFYITSLQHQLQIARWYRLNNFTFYYLKGQCPGNDILLITSSACKSWFCHIWSQFGKPFSKYHTKNSFIDNWR